jgi:hypothetical protein
MIRSGLPLRWNLSIRLQEFQNFSLKITGKKASVEGLGCERIFVNPLNPIV